MQHVLEIMSRRLKFFKTPLIAVFCFLFGCMLTINLTPIDKTCRIEDTDREYNIMKNSKLRNPDLLITILSAPKNLYKRNTIRQTWLRLNEKHEGQNTAIKFKMKHYFVVGSLGLSADDVFYLTTEQSQFGDILILPMWDSYDNLTQKVVKTFEWLQQQFEYGLGFKYLLKCDDDSFVRIDKLSTELYNFHLIYNSNSIHKSESLPFYQTNVQVNAVADNEQNSMQLYWGYFNGRAQVKTGGKWKESDWIACDRYVPYALGGGYILSRKLVSFVSKNSNYLRYFKSEDVSVGFWLAPVRNIVRIHDIRFDTEWVSRGCQNFYLVTHNVPQTTMRDMYDQIKLNGNLCSTQSLKRPHYVYNWTLPPSQCCKHISLDKEKSV